MFGFIKNLVTSKEDRAISSKVVQELLANYVDVAKQIKIDVAYVVDCSGSMTEEFEGGYVTRTFALIHDFAKFVDGDGKLETIGYSGEQRTHDIYTLTTSDDVDSFVKKHYSAGGQTHLVPSLKKMVEKLDHQNPSMYFIITDGHFNDASNVNSIFEQLRKLEKSYFMFIRLGDDAISNDQIQKLADDYSNVGVVDMQDLKMTTENFYKQVLSSEVQKFLNKIYGKA